MDTASDHELIRWLVRTAAATPHSMWYLITRDADFFQDAAYDPRWLAQTNVRVIILQEWIPRIRDKIPNITSKKISHGDRKFLSTVVRIVCLKCIRY